MNENDSKPYVGLTGYNHQVIDYTDGELTLICHLTFSSHLHVTQINKVFFLYCQEGRLKFEMDGTEYELSKDQVFVGYPNAIYNRFEASPDAKCRLMTITPTLLQDMLYPNQSIWDRTLFLKKHYIIPASEQESVMLKCMNTVIDYNLSSKKAVFRKEIIHSLAKSVVYELCRSLSKWVQIDDFAETNQHKIIFERFISILSSSEVKKQPLSFYADKLCVSSRYLTMVCREVSGRTAYDLIRDYVQNDIRYHLLHTNLSVKEIAIKLGFCNLSFFGKYVRENLGKSPSEFRRRLKDT